jgi:predicted ArsR family transcriptional regulator
MSAQNEDQDHQISGVAALNEPVRRALYRYVAERHEEVTRDQAAQELGITRALAAFHLDKLAAEGLLEVRFQRLNGRSGPGAGRPSKLYRRSAREFAVSLPPRSYELAARLLADAVESTASQETRAGVEAAASEFGRNLGSDARTLAGPEASGEALLEAAEAVLASYGFEPWYDETGTLRLRNCPFHLLAAEHRTLVCGMNLALMQGLLEGLGTHGIIAVLDPQPGQCCVAFRPQIALP